MSELETQCVKMIRFAQANLEKTLHSFDTRQLDSLIHDFSKMESNFLQTSNNLNKTLMEADQMNQKLKSFLPQTK